jgi:HlyD family secretion protein
MIRRLFPLLVTLTIFGAFVWTLFFLYKKSEARPLVYVTEQPRRRAIVKKTVAPGAIVPRQEVVIKPRVSGIVQELYVQPGQYVKEKALLAKIQIIPNVVNLNQAEASLRLAEISLETAKSELERLTKLRAQNLVSETDFAQQQLSFRLRQQERETAENNLQLVRVGASKRSGNVSNLVYSTVEGMVLEVPVKEGASVIEANNFNEGTTIAAIANMNDMIFQGRVDESEVGGLREGMSASISVGALGDERFEGVVEYIAPKGVAKEGTIEFEVRAKVQLKASVFVRANYSANADIILQSRKEALALNESFIQEENGASFVEVEVAPQKFERRKVTLGLSDGIWVEIVQGLDDKARVKQKEPAGAADSEPKP